MNLQFYFNQCKEFINNSTRVLIIPDQKEQKKFKKMHLEFIIPVSEFHKPIKIYSISENEYIQGNYIHNSGINVLYYISCMYLNSIGINGKKYLYQSSDKKERMYERVKILKEYNYIYERSKDYFIYYSISYIKEHFQFN